MTSEIETPDDPHDWFPAGFFARSDESFDGVFYSAERLVAHIDATAIQAVGELYTDLGISGAVLDLMSSWISHFAVAPAALTVLGMNENELNANRDASRVVVKDLNVDATLPFSDESFDDVVCCVSIDYLTRPIDVMREVHRVLRPRGRFVCTFSNRCFPSKAIRGWLMVSEEQRIELVARYFALAGGFEEPQRGVRVPLGIGDPLYAVWAQVARG